MSDIVRETVNNWRLWTFPHTLTPYKVSACWIHLIVGETNHGPRLLWNLPWRNKAEKVNFNCHEVMGLWMPSVHWWQPTGVNSMQAPWLFCASHTFCIVFRVGGCMRMMTSFYQDLSFCDFCSFVTFFEANVRLSISPSAIREFHVRLKMAESLVFPPIIPQAEHINLLLK